MNIIIVASFLKAPRKLNLLDPRLIGGSLAALALLVGSGFGLGWALRSSETLALKQLETLNQELVEQRDAIEVARTEAEEELNAMAARLGQLQAQLMRLDTLGERLGQLSGIKQPEAKPVDKSGQGGPLIAPTRPLTPEDLQRQLDQLSRQLESKSDYLGLIESELMDERVKKNQLPTALPVEAQWNASGFGWRIDPFTGEQAMPEGIDFIADTGTQIVAAAAGIVVTAERHPQYGNLIEIDHGNDLITRYAHASKLLVKQGALVKRGQKIAEVGSTGRSTGPHLHFEVRFKGIAQNPNRFLQNAQQQKLALAKRR